MNTTTNQTKAAEIISEIISWNEPLKIRESLRELMDQWFLHAQEEGETFNQDYVETIYFDFKAISDALVKMQELTT